MRSDRINVSLGRTVNLGNFESIRIDVALATDQKLTENRDELFNRAEKWVSTKVNKLVADVEAALVGKKTTKKRR